MPIRSIPNHLLTLGTLLALAPAAPLAAQNLLTNNPSFETPSLRDGATSVGIQNDAGAGLLPWVVVGNTTVGNLGVTPATEIVLTENPTNTQYLGTTDGSAIPNPLDGVQVASFRTGLLTLTGSATQVSNVLLSLNTRFTLTVGVGNPLDSFFQGYVVSLIAGGTTLASVAYNPYAVILPDGITVPGNTVPDGTFNDKTVSFLLDPVLNSSLTPLVGTALTVSLSVPGVPLGSLGANFGTDFDNVRLTTATVVPEPGTTASVGLGLLGLIGAQYARRRRGGSVRA